MVRRQFIVTSRLRTAVRMAGERSGIPILFIHDNVTSSHFFEEILDELAESYWAIAPDLRGFGESKKNPVDGTRGLRDFSDDLRSLIEVLDLSDQPIHWVGWSLGGGVAMQYAIDYPEQVATMTLVAPISPYGFGGTHGAEGIPIWPDYAGSGGGIANPEFVQRLSRKDMSTENPMAPRNILNNAYFKPPFSLDKERENEHVVAMNRTTTGAANYPGDQTESPHWPGMAPGTHGVLNALAPNHCNLSGLVEINPKPPILWMRGDSDQIVSDTSIFDVGYLGQLGAIPGWPGAHVYPSQPMITQTRALLEQYAGQGGQYTEEVIEGCGHSPHIEKKELFLEALALFLRRHL